MNEQRAHEPHSLIEQLRSPIPADEVVRVTAIAAERIRELWMELEYYEAAIEHLRKREVDIEHLKQLQTRRSPISQSGAHEPQQDR
jgi:hypothetical protein